MVLGEFTETYCREHFSLESRIGSRNGADVPFTVVINRLRVNYSFFYLISLVYRKKERERERESQGRPT